MRFLILSDIHANLTALDASLAAAEGRWERILCLGDIVDYGPDPNEVTERVKALDPIIIRGNHDKAVAGLSDLDDFYPFSPIRARRDPRETKPAKSALNAQLAYGTGTPHRL